MGVNCAPLLTDLLEKFLAESEWFWQNKICQFLRQGIYIIYVSHCVFMKHSWTNSFNLSFSFERGYWIPKLHKCPRLQTTLYCWVCQMLHETSFQYINLFYQPSKPDCDTSYSRSGVNQMWILKNYKDML
jgi:hypothetical protein